MVPDQLSELDLNLCVNVLSRALFPICAPRSSAVAIYYVLQTATCIGCIYFFIAYTRKRVMSPGGVVFDIGPTGPSLM